MCSFFHVCGRALITNCFCNKHENALIELGRSTSSPQSITVNGGCECLSSCLGLIIIGALYFLNISAFI